MISLYKKISISGSIGSVWGCLAAVDADHIEHSFIWKHFKYIVGNSYFPDAQFSWVEKCLFHGRLSEEIIMQLLFESLLPKINCALCCLFSAVTVWFWLAHFIEHRGFCLKPNNKNNYNNNEWIYWPFSHWAIRCSVTWQIGKVTKFFIFFKIRNKNRKKKSWIQLFLLFFNSIQ